MGAVAMASLRGLLLWLLVMVTACGADDPGGDARDPSAHNDADVTFATEMIQHHAETLVLVDLTVGRDRLDPELVDLAGRIRESRAPEIEQLSDWLQRWNEPIPETVRDHVNAGHGEDGAGHGAEGFEELERANGDEFRRLWLERTIEHHQGAVELAEQELENGSFGETRELAEKIRDAQTSEIRAMQTMLG